MGRRCVLPLLYDSVPAQPADATSLTGLELSIPWLLDSSAAYSYAAEKHTVPPFSTPTTCTLLPPDSTLVERKLLAFEYVSIHTTALAGTAGDDRVQPTRLELPLKRRLDLAGLLHPLRLLLLHALALLDLLNLRALLLLPSPAQRLSVVCLVPLPERRGVDLHHGGLGQGVCADELVVGGVESHSDDADFAGDTLATPREVAGIETQGAELAVSAAGAHKMDALAADTGVGGLAALLERSALVINMMVDGNGGEQFGLCIPLLAIVCALSTGGTALVTRVTRDTERR